MFLIYVLQFIHNVLTAFHATGRSQTNRLNTSIIDKTYLYDTPWSFTVPSAPCPLSQPSVLFARL